MADKTPHTNSESYGPSDQQRIDYFVPNDASELRGIVALVHGGFWRQQHNSSQMVALAADFAQRGWVVANIEYRRAGCGGDWPHIIDDVRAALRQIRQSSLVRDPATRLVSIGHSVGGELVLLAEGVCDAVVALAPVTDVARTEREHLGENAVIEFFGSSRADAEAVYREASPLEQLPVRHPTLVVHGDQDQRVPLAHSEAYVEAAKDVGSPVTLLEVEGAEHFGMIDPAASHWPAVRRWMAEVLA
jgi:acetyl esterase/lipase